MFYFFAKVYSTDYFVVEIQNETNFSINFPYYSLLLLMLLKKYTTADLGICRHIRLHTKNMLKVLH